MKNEKIEYRGYTIELTEHLYKTMFMFYPTAAGIDCDFDGERWTSNVSHALTIEDAKEEIDEIMLLAEIDAELYARERKSY